MIWGVLDWSCVCSNFWKTIQKQCPNSSLLPWLITCGSWNLGIKVTPLLLSYFVLKIFDWNSGIHSKTILRKRCTKMLVECHEYVAFWSLYGCTCKDISCLVQFLVFLPWQYWHQHDYQMQIFNTHAHPYTKPISMWSSSWLKDLNCTLCWT